MGIEPERLMVLDTLRRKRNLSDYDGEPVSEAMLATCLEEARSLLEYTLGWLHEHHPELVD
ncbi:hypothetical protein LJR232_004445 [Aquipseudomonas alcaligenes]